MAYDASLKVKRDNQNALEYAKQEGVGEGIEKGRIAEKHEIALEMKKRGMVVSLIAELTGLTEDEVRKL